MTIDNSRVQGVLALYISQRCITIFFKNNKKVDINFYICFIDASFNLIMAPQKDYAGPPIDFGSWEINIKEYHIIFNGTETQLGWHDSSDTWYTEDQVHHCPLLANEEITEDITKT